MHTIHPFLVHFPIALPAMCLVFELVAWFSRKPELSQFGWWLQVVGTVWVIVAALSVFAVLVFFRFSSHRALPAGWARLYLAALAVGVTSPSP